KNGRLSGTPHRGSARVDRDLPAVRRSHGCLAHLLSAFARMGGGKPAGVRALLARQRRRAAGLADRTRARALARLATRARGWQYPRVSCQPSMSDTPSSATHSSAARPLWQRFAAFLGPLVLTN